MASKAITELKRTRLFAYLQAIDKQMSLACVQFVSHVTPILQSIVDYFPYYTRHDERHSLRVIKQIEKIIHKDCLRKKSSLAFTASEAFLLICSSYGHDLGMAILPGEDTEILKKINLSQVPGWKNDPVLQEYLRKTHSERGGLYIFQHIDTIGIPLHLHQQLDLLMKAHNMPITSLHIQLGKRFSSDFEEINLLQLASILCIADLLEFSDTRVMEGVIDQLKEALEQSPSIELETSLRENMKHIAIGSNLGVGPDGKIIMSGTFTDSDVLNTAYKTVDYIEKWVRDYGDIDHRTNRKRLKIRTDSVSTTFDIPGREFERLGIRMNKQNVIGLISSNAIWNNRPETVIRELLQNAVEACRYRLHYAQEQKYIPNVQLDLNPSDRTVIINDNGCGMSRSIILNNFLTVGNSRSKESGYASDGYASLARFGIGFWSIFTIAESAVIETSEHLPYDQDNQNGLSFDVNISALKDYILFQKKTMAPGTRITIHLKENVNLNELANKITGPYGVIACSNIPIHITFANRKQEIPFSPVTPTLNELLGPKITFAQKDGVSIFTRNMESGGITINTFVIFRSAKKITCFQHSNGQPIYTLPHNNYEVICVCGFIVRQQLRFPINEVIGDSFGYIANTTNPHGFEYNITRQSLLDSAESVQYSKIIIQQLIETYRAFLKDRGCYTPIEIVRLYHEGTYVSRGGTFDTNNQLFQIITEAADLLCYKLYRLSCIRNFKNCDVEYMDITELLKRNYRIITAVQNFSIHGTGQLLHLNDESIYALCTNYLDSSDNVFFTKRGEFDLLFTNDPNSFIIFIKISAPALNPAYVSLFVTNTETVDPRADKSWIIGMVRGQGWTGYIAERKILNANFAFAKQKCFLQLGSELAHDIRVLYNEGQYPEICGIISKLELALYGHVDDSVKKYL